MSAIGIVLMLILGQVGDRTTPEVEDALAAARSDLAQRLGVAEETIEAHALWPVVWPDTSLGVREPDMMYAQVLVPGGVVLFKVGEELFEYHISDKGRAVYAGPYVEPPEVAASTLIEDPQQVQPGRVAVEGMLVRTRDGALLYDELVDPQQLPTGVLPVLVLGNALQPFIERRWADLEDPSAWVRIEGQLEVRKPNESGVGWGRNGEFRARIRADRIQILADRGRVSGVLSYAELAADPGKYDQMIITVRGQLRTGFEICALGPDDAAQDGLPLTWVEGNLEGLPRPVGGTREVVRVEIAGLFEARPRGGYGPSGAYPCRLTARAAYAVSSILDYPSLLERAAGFSGRLITVRGLLFLGDGMSDLTSLTWAPDGGPLPVCLVAGDLSGLAEQSETGAGAGLPVQIHGRFEAAAQGDGYGRDGTRSLRIESVFARLLSPAELPPPPQPRSLAVLKERADGLGDLVIQHARGTCQTLTEGLADFALAPEGADGILAAVRPTGDGLALYMEAPEGEPTKLAEGESIRMPLWSPKGAALAAIVDDEVIVWNVSTAQRVATGQVPFGSSGRIVEFFWADSGDVLALNVVDTETGKGSTLSLNLATLETAVLHPDATVFCLLPRVPSWACYLDPAGRSGGGTLLAGDCPTCGVQNKPLFDIPAGEALVAYAQHPEKPLGVAAMTSATEESATVRVYLVRTDGSGERRLVYSGAQEVRHPRWSDDGDAFAFVARRAGTWRAVLMGVDARPILQVSGILPTVPGIIATESSAN